MADRPGLRTRLAPGFGPELGLGLGLGLDHWVLPSGNIGEDRPLSRRPTFITVCHSARVIVAAGQSISVFDYRPRPSCTPRCRANPAPAPADPASPGRPCNLSAPAPLADVDHHPRRKASATVSVCGPRRFDGQLSPPLAVSPTARLARKQSIESIWQGAHAGVPADPFRPTAAAPEDTPCPSGQFEPPTDRVLCHRLTRRLAGQEGDLVDVQAVEYELLPWEENRQWPALALTRHGKLLKVSLRDAHVDTSASLVPCLDGLWAFTGLATIHHPSSHHSFVLCLSPLQSLCVVVQLPHFKVLPTHLQLPGHSYLQLVCKQLATRSILVGLCASGEVIEYELGFEPTSDPARITITSVCALGSVVLNHEQPSGILFDSTGNALVVWSHQAIHISINRQPFFQLRPEQSDLILNIHFLTPNLFSVLTPTTLKLYTIQSTASLLKNITLNSDSLRYESVTPLFDHPQQFLAVVLDTSSGQRSVRHLASDSANQVLYAPSQNRPAPPQNTLVTAVDWLDPTSFDTVVLGLASGHTSVHSLPMTTNPMTSPEYLMGSISALTHLTKHLVLVGSSKGDIGIFDHNLTLQFWTVIAPVSIQRFVLVDDGGRFLIETSNEQVVVCDWTGQGGLKIDVEIVRRWNAGFGKRINKMWTAKVPGSLFVSVIDRKCQTVIYQLVPGDPTTVTVSDSQQWLEVQTSPPISTKLRIGISDLADGAYARSSIQLAKLVIRDLMVWGVDDKLDKCVSKGLGVAPHGTFNGPEALEWSDGELGVSETLNLLKLVVSLRVFLDDPATERAAGEAIERVVTGMLEGALLGTLSRFWLDKSVEIRASTRMLFLARLGQVSDQLIGDLVERWEVLLPSQDREKVPGFDNEQGVILMEQVEDDVSTDAMLLIGLIVSERYKLLSTRTLKAISISIFTSLDSSSLQAQLIAVELCGRAFEIVQNYIDAMEMLRKVFRLATGKDLTTSLELRSNARQAVLHVAAVNTPLFMTTLAYDMMASELPDDRIATMKLVIFMVRKKPLVLYTSLPRLAEAVVKSLDPTHKQMRSSTQSAATIILSELVKTYPSIAFDKLSQRLAVGTEEGAIIIYDLKTSTRLDVLESYRKPVTACSFSPDGHRLVTLCLEEGQVEVWKLGTGLMSWFLPSAVVSGKDGEGIFSSSSTSSSNLLGSTNGSGNVGTRGGYKAFKSFPFNVGEEALMSTAATLEWVVVEWVTDRSCRLRIRESSLNFAC